jgi:hypothetical protein|tara:strand:- start:370 stop:627 length:258 start_codon:yes stop_codon:yes gene_type:complete
MAGTVVKIKQSTVAGKKPVSNDLQQGELAINVQDQILYSKDASGEIFAIGSIKEIDMGNWNSDVLLDGGDNNDAVLKTYDGGASV